MCDATHAGIIEYEGLPGSLRSGCQLSPAYRSKYCFHHSPRVATTEDDNASDKEGVVKFIIGKRVTRNGVTHNVCILSCSVYGI